MYNLFTDSDEELMFRTLITIEFGDHYFTAHSVDLTQNQKTRIREIYVDVTGKNRLTSLLAYKFIIEYMIKHQKGE